MERLGLIGDDLPAINDTLALLVVGRGILRYVGSYRQDEGRRHGLRRAWANLGRRENFDMRELRHGDPKIYLARTMMGPTSDGHMAFSERWRQGQTLRGYLFVYLRQAPLDVNPYDPKLFRSGCECDEKSVWQRSANGTYGLHVAEVVLGRALLLSEQMDAWVISSSEEVTLSSSSAVSSRRLLFCV